MNLQIRNPRAYELARQLAEKRKVTMTDAVIEALEEQLKREAEEKPLGDRLQDIVDDLWSKRGPNGREMSKDEIDRMWGHE